MAVIQSIVENVLLMKQMACLHALHQIALLLVAILNAQEIKKVTLLYNVVKKKPKFLRMSSFFEKLFTGT